MRLLLDTHVLLWLMDDNDRLKSRGRELVEAASEVFASSASIWEIAIKSRIGKIDANTDKLVALIAEAGLTELPVTFRHAVASGQLPLHHRDPFDRLLIAQAVSEQLLFLTADTQLRAYSELVACV